MDKKWKIVIVTARGNVHVCSSVREACMYLFVSDGTFRDWLTGRHGLVTPDNYVQSGWEPELDGMVAHYAVEKFSETVSEEEKTRILALQKYRNERNAKHLTRKTKTSKLK